jgi:hypothetical protein
MKAEYIVQFRPGGEWVRRRIRYARFSSVTYHVPLDSAKMRGSGLTSWQPRRRAVCSFYLKLTCQQNIHSVRSVGTGHESRFVPIADCQRFAREAVEDVSIG